MNCTENNFITAIPGNEIQLLSRMNDQTHEWDKFISKHNITLFVDWSNESLDIVNLVAFRFLNSFPVPFSKAKIDDRFHATKTIEDNAMSRLLIGNACTPVVNDNAVINVTRDATALL